VTTALTQGFITQVAGLLGHSLPSGVGGDPGQVHTPRAMLDANGVKTACVDCMQTLTLTVQVTFGEVPGR